MTDLFAPYMMGPNQLANRIVMAPLTRCRAEAGNVASLLAAEYYRQRASAGLIISEGSQVSPYGQGYAHTPGIYNEAQATGWKRVTDAVHTAGGKIFIQLWHVGRTSHPDFMPDGRLPIAPSAINPNLTQHTPLGKKPSFTPHALSVDEIAAVIEEFRIGAKLAKQAGFDGAEIHGANGYLIEQFLKDGANVRTDAYGGSPENRCRFALEIAKVVIGEFGADRVGIRLSPNNDRNGLKDSNPAPTYRQLVSELSKLALVYIHVIEGITGGARNVADGMDLSELKALFKGSYMVNNGYTGTMAEQAVQSGIADLVCFGKPFISNPDLVERLKRGARLAEPDVATFYSPGAHGYTDYPSRAA
jgi:N-ethylmaleimide reductase